MRKKHAPILFNRLIFPGILFLCLSFSNQVLSQEVLPTYSDYLTDNLYLLHPSMAGASKMNKLRLTARQQWFGVKDAPSLETFSAHMRIKEKIGVGGILFNDQNGNFSRRGFYGSFAYHLLLSESLNLNQLSFGISGGIIQHHLDQSRFSENDPIIGERNPSDIYGIMDVGVSYYYKDFFAHLTGKNLLSMKRDLFLSESASSNQRKYYFSAGYVFTPVRTSWSYEPSVLFQWREETEEKAIDANFKVYRSLNRGGLFGGLSYRRSLDGTLSMPDDENRNNQQLQYLTPFVGFEHKNLLLAYTYSQQLNSVVLSQGFHQITLGYNFGMNRGRYDCTCPAVNRY